MTDTALALGSFDGIHLGHKAVLQSALCAQNPVAVVFDVPPSMAANGKSELLLEIDQKHRLLNELGFSVETLDFLLVKDIEAYDFLQYLKEKYNPAKICCGFNYRFGAKGLGTTETLQKFCSENGIILSVTPAVEIENERVSSSLIRSLVRLGDVKKAAALLGRPFCLCGEVVRGDMRGRTIGFPTVNFQYPKDIVEMKHGVYSAFVSVKGKEYPAVCYVGFRPSYRLLEPTVETHIIGFSGDLYGSKLCIELKDFIRDEKVFSSLEELKNQLEKDILSAK